MRGARENRDRSSAVIHNGHRWRPVADGPSSAGCKKGGNSMVILLNNFVIQAGKEGDFEETFRTTGPELVKTQKGLIRYRLHRSLSDRSRYVNYVEWESREDFERAVRSPALQEVAEKVQKIATINPEFYEIVTEANFS
jgi:heme-degrading monooxygenase HmoA